MRREEARSGSAVTGASESYGNQKRLSVYLNGKPLDLLPDGGILVGKPAGFPNFIFCPPLDGAQEAAWAGLLLFFLGEFGREAYGLL